MPPILTPTAIQKIAIIHLSFYGWITKAFFYIKIHCDTCDWSWLFKFTISAQKKKAKVRLLWFLFLSRKRRSITILKLKIKFVKFFQVIFVNLSVSSPIYLCQYKSVSFCKRIIMICHTWWFSQRQVLFSHEISICPFWMHPK